MEIINTPISSPLISAFDMRKRWDTDKRHDLEQSIAREEDPKILPSLIEDYDEVSGSLSVWFLMTHRLSLKTKVYEANTEYARLEVYAYTVNLVLSSNNHESYSFTQGANYALLESYSLISLVP